MDSSEVSIAANGVLCSSKSVKKEIPKKRIPLVPYVPPHRRNSSSTNYVEFTVRKSDLNYSDHSYDKLAKTEKLIYSTNDLSDDSLSVRSRTNTNLKKDIVVHEKQTLKFSNENIEQTSINNTIEKERSVSESTFDSDDHSGSENLDMYDTASDLDSEFMIPCNQENRLRKVKSNAYMHNEGSNLLSSVTHDIRKVVDNVEKEKNDNLIIERILDLANVYVNITFKTMLTELYSKKYSEHIPSTVLQEINFLVSVNNESKIKDVTPSKKEVVNNGPKLLTSEDIGSRFLVKIYNCKSITEIWGKIMNAINLRKLDQLLREMKNFYVSGKLVASSIKEGGFYVVFKDDYWHRVKCLKCNESTALVLFIDRGDEYTFSLKNIFELYDKFALLPAQAIKMSLSDLEDLSDCDEAFIILKDKLQEKTVYATRLFYCYETKSCNVQLYLNIYEENINIADMVIEQLLRTFLNPKFNIETEEMIHVYISYVNENRIFVQLIKSKSYAYFLKLFRNVTMKYLDKGNLQHERNLNENYVYLVQNPDTKMWYRAKVLKCKSGGTVETLLIDTGANICMNKEDFYHLEKFSSILTKYPEQAIEVQVHGLSKFYEHERLEYFRKLMQSTNTFFALFITKILENNIIPTIRLFKKELDNSLTPINDKLWLNQNFQISSRTAIPLKKSESSNDDIKSHQLQKMLKMQEQQRSLSLTSISSVLDPPQIPKDYSDVHIIFVDNPSKFVIQLLSSKFGELKKLDCELSDACNSYKGLPLTVESMKIGQLYAAKFDEYDYKWYRVYLLQVTDIKLARVYYCDYGYYKEVQIENIVPLATQFHQLPYQAVWAQLYGIKPIFERWTLDDASRFRDLTQLKNFACIIKSKESFKPQSCQTLMPITAETVYSLELVDTSTAEDIYIADMLVEERRALKCK